MSLCLLEYELTLLTLRSILKECCKQIEINIILDLIAIDVTQYEIKHQIFIDIEYKAIIYRILSSQEVTWVHWDYYFDLFEYLFWLDVELALIVVRVYSAADFEIVVLAWAL